MFKNKKFTQIGKRGSTAKASDELTGDETLLLAKFFDDKNEDMSY